MGERFRRCYDFARPLDDAWEVIPGTDWSFDAAPRRARLVNRGDANAEIYIRPCSIYGDTIELAFAPDEPKRGRFVCGFLVGFEFISVELDLETGRLAVLTHEFHKEQPRLLVHVPRAFSRLSLHRTQEPLHGLPYEGSRVRLSMDGENVAELGQIDFLPESHLMFGLKGKGTVTLSSVTISGPARPRPEFLTVGVWKKAGRPTIDENVESLVTGTRRAAEAGVEVLVTPETSLTGLDLLTCAEEHEEAIAAGLRRFQEAVRAVPDAPHVLIGYPGWVPGTEVEGATLPRVKLNVHRFVCPDGTLGPMMAKVHSCELGVWHGRRYNLQRVRGVEVAMGVCHDGRYEDVWATGVMGGARLCLHPSAGGKLSGRIPDIVRGYAGLGEHFDAFWVHVNAGGGAAIVYPDANAKQRETVLAVTPDLTEQNPTHPEYSDLGDQLAHARIRLWDATGCYPLRTLRNGSRAYRLWSELVPALQQV